MRISSEVLTAFARVASKATRAAEVVVPDTVCTVSVTLLAAPASLPFSPCNDNFLFSNPINASSLFVAE